MSKLHEIEDKMLLAEVRVEQWLRELEERVEAQFERFRVWQRKVVKRYVEIKTENDHHRAMERFYAVSLMDELKHHLREQHPNVNESGIWLLAKWESKPNLYNAWQELDYILTGRKTEWMLMMEVDQMVESDERLLSYAY